MSERIRKINVIKYKVCKKYTTRFHQNRTLHQRQKSFTDESRSNLPGKINSKTLKITFNQIDLFASIIRKRSHIIVCTVLFKSRNHSFTTVWTEHQDYFAWNNQGDNKVYVSIYCLFFFSLHFTASNWFLGNSRSIISKSSFHCDSNTF